MPMSGVHFSWCGQAGSAVPQLTIVAARRSPKRSALLSSHR